MADIDIVYRRGVRWIIWPLAATLLAIAMWLVSGLVTTDVDLGSEFDEPLEEIHSTPMMGDEN